jgi:putative oxidoreductase
MTTHVDIAPPIPEVPSARLRSLRALVPIGRVLFAAVFILSVGDLFSPAAIRHAAALGVPLAGLLVPIAGIISFLGGLSVAFGYRTRWGAGLLVLFLVPVTLTMHRFWSLPDPQMARVQAVMFMKNLSMLGGALFLMYFGGGPFSADLRMRRLR